MLDKPGQLLRAAALAQSYRDLHRPGRSSVEPLPYEKATFDAEIADPPYYDNISYSDLSDFFYVWLRRSVGHLYPEHFTPELTPKRAEIIAVAYRHDDDKEEARRAYEQMMEEALRESRRVLAPARPTALLEPLQRRLTCRVG